MTSDYLFEKKFLKEDSVPSTPVYEIYANAAKKLWDSYHMTYDLRPRSAAKVPGGANRSVNFYENNKHILEIAIGKTTTIYVLDEILRSKIHIEYNQDSSGHYRHTFDSFEECYDAIDGVLTKNSDNFDIDKIPRDLRSKLFVVSDIHNDMLAQVAVLKNEYSQIEITNIDQTNVRQWRAAYFYDKNVQRRNNQLLEVWYEKRNDRLVFVLPKSLMTASEIKEADNNKRATANRGRLYRYDMTREELLDYIRGKLDIYVSNNDELINAKEDNSFTDLYLIQLSKSGLNQKENWKGDPRDRFIKLFRPLTDGTEYYFEHNTTDSSGKLLELYRKGENKRVMLFKGKQDMTIGIAFNIDFYNYIKQTVELPDNQKEYRSQPHMDISLMMLWNVVCAATGKKQYLVKTDELSVKRNAPLTAVKKSIKTKQTPLSKYKVIRAIDDEKHIYVVHNTEDGKDYVQKEYKQYSRNIFERLKLTDIPGIPRICECIEENKTLLTVEEFIDGRNLEEVIFDEGFFDEEKMLHIALAICDILEELHAMNPPLIHRDIKPSNIMLKENGDVVLIDFNASREHKEGYTQDTILLGTKNFAAPEQLMGFGDSDGRTDIFGLGATLSYIMTGRPINRMVVPGKYGSIFKKCIEMDKKNRYQSIDELRKALLNA